METFTYDSEKKISGGVYVGGMYHMLDGEVFQNFEVHYHLGWY